MHINGLKHYPGKDHLGAYKDIKRYSLRHAFTHEQWSGYHSISRITDLEFFDLVPDTLESLRILETL